MIRTLLFGLSILLMMSSRGFAQDTVVKKAVNLRPVKKENQPLKVIQTGYSTLSSNEISGAISTVTGKSLENLIVPNFQSALQGNVAGVQVIQANGQPGSDVVIRIRGTSSIFAETEPLYIIDGAPVFSGPREHAVKGIGAGWGAVYNPLSGIDPSDIESIEILKDAAATAIYGARGGNGVILVTTKKSEKDKTLIRLDHYQGITSAANRLNSLSGPQYLAQLDRAFLNAGGTGQGPLPSLPVWNRSEAEAVNTNNLDEVLETGRVQQLNLSVNHGSNKTSFYVSGAYRKEKGIISGNDLLRYSGRMSISNQISRRLTIGARLAINFSDHNSVPVGYSPGGGFSAAQRNLPIYPLYNPDGTYFYPTNLGVLDLPGSNVASFQSKKEFDNRESARRITFATSLNYKIAHGLDLTVDGMVEKYYQTQLNYLSKRLRLGSSTSGTLAGFPTAYLGYEKYSNDLYNVRTTLNYARTYGKHKISGVAGFEFIHNENPYFFYEGEGYPSESTRVPSSATYKNPNTAEALIANTFTFAGYFGNANYSFSDKYLLGATLRVDGSSRFGAENKYIAFPAASVGWIISKEDYLKSSKVVNFLKVRASYGLSGNAGIGNYSSLERWETNNNSRYLQQAGIQLAGIGSVNLKPEINKQFDVGIDFEVANKRISGALDFYNKKTDNLILAYEAPLSAGITTSGLLLNAGSLRNRGVELSLTSKNTTGLLKWSTTLNIAHNNNKVLDLGGLSPDQISSHLNVEAFVGQQVGVFYLAEYAGVDPATGEELIYDLNGTKVAALSATQINAARKPIVDKPSAPKFFGGLNNTFAYKSFDLSAFVTFSYGNYVLDEGERALSYLTGSNNLRETAVNSWTSANSNTDFPRLKYNDAIAGTNTTRFLHDASYLRMKNITLGYSFRNNIKKVKFLKDARLFVSAQNLFTITGFPGWDPEVSGNNTTNITRSMNQGITYMDVPQVRTFAFGFNLHL